MITKRGRDLQAVEVAGSYGSQDTREGRLSYGNRFENGFELLLSGTAFKSDGDDHINYPELDAPSIDVDDEEADSLFANLSYHDFSLQAAYSTREKKFPTGAWETINTDPRNKTTDDLFFLNLGYEHAFRNQMEFNGNLSYQRYEYDGGYVYDYAWKPTQDPDIVVNKDWVDSNWCLYGENHCQ